MTDYYPEVTARFEAETKQHEMQVLLDQGLYRHLRFARPKSTLGLYWFDIVTWPGCLHIRGDVRGDFTFSRLPDMFEFFRTPSGRINPDYWAEKLAGGRPSVKEYSETKLRQLVVECFVESARYDGVPRGTGKAIREQILNRDLEDGEYARSLVDGFEFGPSWRTNCSCGDGIDVEDGTQEVVWRNRHMREFPGRDHRFTSHSLHRFFFANAWEWDTSDYSFEFLWACHAIVDGIRRYDGWKAEQVAGGGSRG